MTANTTNSNRLTVTATNGVSFPNANAATTGLLIGTDTNLYRSGTDILKTDDNFHAANFQTVGVFIGNPASATNNTFRSRVQGVANDHFFITGEGKMRWGAGSTLWDTELLRTEANVLSMAAGDKLQQAELPVVANDLTNQVWVERMDMFHA